MRIPFKFYKKYGANGMLLPPPPEASEEAVSVTIPEAAVPEIEEVDPESLVERFMKYDPEKSKKVREREEMLKAIREENPHVEEKGGDRPTIPHGKKAHLNALLLKCDRYYQLANKK
jgi:hypothetical protein